MGSFSKQHSKKVKNGIGKVLEGLLKAGLRHGFGHTEKINKTVSKKVSVSEEERTFSPGEGCSWK